MAADKVTRRQFVRDSAFTAAGLAAGLTAATIVRAGNPGNVDTSKILNYNADMEYRRCGRTGLVATATIEGHRLV